MRDEPRRDTAAGVRQLCALCVQPVMLSGDNRRTAEAVVADVRLDAVAGLLPQDKMREITALRARGPVVMVGDGINDAPSLATADVGIALGGAFNVALEIGDTAILQDRLAGWRLWCGFPRRRAPTSARFRARGACTIVNLNFG